MNHRSVYYTQVQYKKLSPYFAKYRCFLPALSEDAARVGQAGVECLRIEAGMYEKGGCEGKYTTGHYFWEVV
jgi:hypothetical protein